MRQRHGLQWGPRPWIVARADRFARYDRGETGRAANRAADAGRWLSEREEAVTDRRAFARDGATGHRPRPASAQQQTGVLRPTSRGHWVTRRWIRRLVRNAHRTLRKSRVPRRAVPLRRLRLRPDRDVGDEETKCLHPRARDSDRAGRPSRPDGTRAAAPTKRSARRVVNRVGRNYTFRNASPYLAPAIDDPQVRFTKNLAFGAGDSGRPTDPLRVCGEFGRACLDGSGAVSSGRRINE